MSVDEGLVAWVREAVEPMGQVTMRKMMGGATLYLDGSAFAIIESGQFWFKADRETDKVWDEAGCGRFSYTYKDGRTATMNYRNAPLDVHDDPEAMRRWAALALEAGLRSEAKKGPKR